MNVCLSGALPASLGVASTHDHLVGVLPGEGVGPDIIAVTLDILRAVERHSDHRFQVRHGGDIGALAERRHGRALTPDVVEFCASTFGSGGAILCGPGGGRFVYDLRAQFDLYCKLSPIVPLPALNAVGAVAPHARKGVNIVAVRENTGGAYFGSWGAEHDGDEMSSAFHRFEYSAGQVERTLDVAVKLAEQRRRKLCLVVKPGGVPSISALWMERFADMTQRSALETSILEIDNATYQLVARAQDFDVVVSPNMYGDILADCAALLLGSRGLSYSGNFGSSGKAVYQTGHGAAHDLAGKDVANPIGQICSLVMMLRESFGLAGIASLIEAAVQTTLANGWRTRDIAEAGSHVVGTRELGLRIVETLEARLADAGDCGILEPETTR